MFKCHTQMTRLPFAAVALQGGGVGMFRTLVVCLWLYFGTVHGDVRQLCRRMLLNSAFRTACSDGNRWYPRYWYKFPCLVSTAADEEFLKNAGMRFIYQEPGVTKPKICVSLRDKWHFGECVSAPAANNTVAYSFSGWRRVEGVWRNNLRLRTGEDCPYQSTAKENYDLKVTADNFGEVYIDGKFISRDLQWPTISSYKFIAGTKVMAFVTWNLEETGATGLRAFINTYNVKTDDKSGWVCSEEYELNWEQIDFDDSHWTPAHIDSVSSHADVGSGAVTIGCQQRGPGAEYFRIKLDNISIP